MSREIMSIANEIMNANKQDFIGIRINRDPRLPMNTNWLSVDDVLKIHTQMILNIGGKSGVHNMQDLEYYLKRPLTDIVGVPKKDIFERICECAYHIARCFVDCGAQTAATIFLTLCKMNNLNIKFEVGEIYGIFPKVLDMTLSYDEFKRYMYRKYSGEVFDSVVIVKNPFDDQFHIPDEIDDGFALPI